MIQIKGLCATDGGAFDRVWNPGIGVGRVLVGPLVARVDADRLRTERTTDGPEGTEATAS